MVLNLLDNVAKVYSIIGIFTTTNFVVSYNGTSSCKLSLYPNSD